MIRKFFLSFLLLMVISPPPVSNAQNSGGNGGGNALIIKVRMGIIIKWAEANLENDQLNTKLELNLFGLSSVNFYLRLKRAFEHVNNQIEISSFRNLHQCIVDEKKPPYLYCDSVFWDTLSEEQKNSEILADYLKISGLSEKISDRISKKIEAFSNEIKIPVSRSLGSANDDFCSAVILLPKVDETILTAIQKILDTKRIVSTNNNHFYTHRLMVRSGKAQMSRYIAVDIFDDMGNFAFGNHTKELSLRSKPATLRRMVGDTLDSLPNCNSIPKSKSYLNNEVFLFKIRLQKISAWISSKVKDGTLPKIFKLNGGGIDSETFLKNFNATVAEVTNSVSINSTPATLLNENGTNEERICTNTKAPQESIHCNINRWEYLSEALKNYIEFHEILGLAGLESNQEVTVSVDPFSSLFFYAQSDLTSIWIKSLIDSDQEQKIATLQNACDWVVYVWEYNYPEARKMITELLLSKNIHVSSTQENATTLLEFNSNASNANFSEIEDAYVDIQSNLSGNAILTKKSTLAFHQNRSELIKNLLRDIPTCPTPNFLPH